MASTADCKKLIVSKAAEFGYSANAVWKRTRKWKEDGVDLRSFDSDNGDRVTISEDASGQLTIEFVFVNTPIPNDLKATLTKEKLICGIIKAYLDSFPKAFEDISSSSYDEVTEVGFERIKEYVETGDESRLIDIHKYLQFKKYPELFINIIRNLENVNGTHFVEDLDPNTVGITYDKENIDAEFHEHEGFHFLKLTMGGDWEWPICAYVYWSEVEQRAKGFFPKGDGNVYNKDFDCAYGNEYDHCDHLSDVEQTRYEEEAADIISDTGPELAEKAMKVAIGQLKQQILQESIDLLNK